MQSSLALGLVGSRPKAAAARISSVASHNTSEASASKIMALSTSAHLPTSQVVCDSSCSSSIASSVDNKNYLTTTTKGSRGPLETSLSIDEWGFKGGFVDKKNPFIGYFQNGNEPNPAPANPITKSRSRLVLHHQKPPLPQKLACQRQNSQQSPNTPAMSSILSRQQQKFTQWLSEKTKLYGVFKREEEESTKRQQPCSSSFFGLFASASRNDAGTSSSQKPVEDPVKQPVIVASNSRFQQDFEILGQLGQGGQGIVYHTRSRVDGCEYAVKQVELNGRILREPQSLEQALREVKSMASMPPHMNVVRYHTAWIEAKEEEEEHGAKDQVTQPSKQSGTVTTKADTSVSIAEPEQEIKPSMRREELKPLRRRRPEVSVSNGLSISALEASVLQLEPSKTQIQRVESCVDFEDEFSMRSVSRFSIGSEADDFDFDKDVDFEEDPSGFISFSRMDHSISKEPNAEPSPVVAKPVDQPKKKSSSKKAFLYIQMELCGLEHKQQKKNVVDEATQNSNSSGNNSDTPLDHLLRQFKSNDSTASAEEQRVFHTNVTSWLRSTVDDRACEDESIRLARHVEGLQLFVQAVQGVHHMHGSCVIHRDLKPDNIFIHNGVAKLGDFGLSKSLFADESRSSSVNLDVASTTGSSSSGDSTISSSSCSSCDGNCAEHTTALGTLTYASPEQLGTRFLKNQPRQNSALKSAKYSIKSDIFALGVILLEFCCPFTTMMERSQVLTAIRHGVVPQRALQLYPKEMSLVLRMVSFDPAERPMTEEIIEQVQAILFSYGKGLKSVNTPVTRHGVLSQELQDIQMKLSIAVHQLRDRSQSSMALENLLLEINEQVRHVSVAMS